MSDLLSKMGFAPDVRLNGLIGENRTAETDDLSESQRLEAARQMGVGHPVPPEKRETKPTSNDSRVRTALDELRRGMDRMAESDNAERRAEEVAARLEAALAMLGNAPEGTVGLDAEAGARLIAYANAALDLAKELKASDGSTTDGVGKVTQAVNLQDIAAVEQRVREAISALSEVRSEIAGRKDREATNIINLSGALVGLEAAGLRLSDSVSAAVAADHTREKILGSVKVALLAQGNISRELARILLWR